MRTKILSTFAAAAIAGTFAVQAIGQTNTLVLNEANCVTGDKYLEVSGSGSTIKIGTDTGMVNARIQGNGNNWIELLVTGEDDVVNHTADLRGYTLHWRFDKGDGVGFGEGTITFRDVAAFAAIKKGTLITISEFQKVSYDPSADTSSGANGGHKRWAGIDGYGVNKAYVSGKTTANGTLVNLGTGAQNSTYHLHFWAGDTSAESHLGAYTDVDDNGDPIAYSDYFIFQGETNDGVIGVDAAAGLFTVNNDNWGMEIVDALDALVMDWVGEDEALYTAGGVSSGEVLKLQKVATDETGHATYAYQANYSNALLADGKESTMGVVNKWSAGTKTQDLTSVR